MGLIHCSEMIEGENTTLNFKKKKKGAQKGLRKLTLSKWKKGSNKP